MFTICHITTESHINMFRLMRQAKSAVNAGMVVYAIAEGETECKEGVNIIGFPGENNKHFTVKRLFGRTKRMIETALEIDADIYQIHNPEFLFYANELKKAGKIVIFDSHEIFAYQIREKYYIPKPLRNIIATLYEKYETYVCSKIDCVLYPSTINDGENYFEKKTKRSLKVENYSSVEMIPHNDKNPTDVVYAGFLTETRGITTLVNAVKKTKARLVLCGSFFPPEYEQEILSLGGEKVKYLGNLTRRELFDCYSRVSIGMCVLKDRGQYAKSDNLNTKTYEYMQCGLPVIFSNFRYALKVNQKYKYGIPVDPNNEEQIADAIDYLIDNPDVAKTMGENGKFAFSNEFNWNIEANKLLDLYKDLLKNK